MSSTHVPARAGRVNRDEHICAWATSCVMHMLILMRCLSWVNMAVQHVHAREGGGRRPEADDIDATDASLLRTGAPLEYPSHTLIFLWRSLTVHADQQTEAETREMRPRAVSCELAGPM